MKENQYLVIFPILKGYDFEQREKKRFSRLKQNKVKQNSEKEMKGGRRLLWGGSQGKLQPRGDI